MPDIEENQDGPSFRTTKEIMRLGDHELVECLEEQQWLLDFYANNNQPEDPVTKELTLNLERLGDELERRLQAGTFHMSEADSDQGEPFMPGSPLSHKRRRASEVFLFYVTLAGGAAGAVLGYFLSPTHGFLGALGGLIVGICLPGVVLVVLVIVYLLISTSKQLFRRW